MLKEREEYYIKLIKESNSLLEVCRKANIVATTGNYDTLKKIIKNNKIDISHFKRFGGNSCWVKRNIEDYLSNKCSISSYKLKNRLLKEGIKECKCEKCGGTEWLGKPIPLELHHKDGNNLNNSLDNLEILCPNCHSFTDNYGGKNQHMNIREKSKKEHNRALKDEEKERIVELSKTAKTIKEIAVNTKHEPRTIKKVLEEKNITIKNVDKTELIIESLKKTKSYTQTAKEFGVSDNAIRKYLNRRGYPNGIKKIIEFLIH